MMNKGFTLVEILIVVIILGILAAIVVPQFTEASSDAKLSNMTSNLQAVRAQLELYRLQHNDNYPAAATVVEQLTGRTDQDGTINAAGAYGPYLQQMPVNPFITPDPAGDLGTKYGWTFDGATGEFRAVADADGHENY